MPVGLSTKVLVGGPESGCKAPFCFQGSSCGHAKPPTHATIFWKWGAESNAGYDIIKLQNWHPHYLKPGQSEVVLYPTDAPSKEYKLRAQFTKNADCTGGTVFDTDTSMLDGWHFMNTLLKHANGRYFIERKVYHP